MTPSPSLSQIRPFHRLHPAAAHPTVGHDAFAFPKAPTPRPGADESQDKDLDAQR
jgi:hypothetical protein